MENVILNADQVPSPTFGQELLTALTQNDETIRHNFATIDDVTQVLDNRLAENIHDDLEKTILRRPRDEATLAVVEAGNDGNADNDDLAGNAVDAVNDEVAGNAGIATDPPAYSPTRAWMYEPIIALDSDSDVQ